MKRTILNLIAIAALSLSGMSLAVEDVAPVAMPMDGGAEQAATSSDSATNTSIPESEPVVKNMRRDVPTKTNRSHTLDLRYCLELESNAAIAKCAGE